MNWYSSRSSSYYTFISDHIDHSCALICSYLFNDHQYAVSSWIISFFCSEGLDLENLDTDHEISSANAISLLLFFSLQPFKCQLRDCTIFQICRCSENLSPALTVEEIHLATVNVYHSSCKLHTNKFQFQTITTVYDLHLFLSSPPAQRL